MNSWISYNIYLINTNKSCWEWCGITPENKGACEHNVLLLELYSFCWNHVLFVEIIFSLMKVVEGMSIKGVWDPE